jgi:hypothetical protein
MHAAFLRRPRSWKAFSFFFRLFLVGSTLLFWLITAARNISAMLSVKTARLDKKPV